jgi:glycosyltransferase involved in cell wall biosynthesis
LKPETNRDVSSRDRRDPTTSVARVDDAGSGVLRVGIEFPFTDRSWMGGVNGVADLLHALAKQTRRRVEPVVIAAPNTPGELLEELPPVEILRTSLVDAESRAYLLRRLAKRALRHDFIMEAWLRRNDIGVLSHCSSLGKRSSIPTIGKIADFSWMHFKGSYPAAAWRRKYAGAVRVCDEWDTLLLHAEAVADDYRAFFPDAKAKPAVLHCIPARLAPMSETPPLQTLVARHGMPEKYFYAPNQFWVHKNHRTIIAAMSQLVEQGHDIHVVSTGKTADDRHPDYFLDLMREVERLGLTTRFHVLGVVPYADVATFMRHCVAVVSASLAEGWGITISEAALMGKSVILSDIPVFREQAPKFGVFFDPSNPQELAEHLAQAWRTYSVIVDIERQKEAENRKAAAIAAFATGYENIVIETALRRRNRLDVEHRSQPDGRPAT